MVEPVIDDSLVLWLNGACGKNSPATRRWVDLSGKGNHGELQNFGFGEGSGWTGEGLEFDGVDDCVLLDNHPSPIVTNSATIEMWIKVLSYPATVNPIIGQNYELGFCFWHYSSTYWIFEMQRVSHALRMNLDIPPTEHDTFLPLNEWVHLVGTAYNDGVKARIEAYKNGEYYRGISFSGKDYNAIYAPDKAYYVGNRGVNIKLALHRFYSRALSPEEVLQNYQAGYTWTPQIGHRTVTSVVKPITASASRAGRGRRDVISTVKPITGSAERKGVGRREVISTVKPITAKATRKGVGKREVVSTVKPIVSTVNLKLPPIKAVLGITERRAEMRITERKPKIEIK